MERCQSWDGLVRSSFQGYVGEIDHTNELFQKGVFTLLVDVLVLDLVVMMDD